MVLNHLLAQTSVPLGGTKGFEGLGPLGNEGQTFSWGSFATKFEGVLSVIIGVLTISAGIWFIFQIFAGAYQWLASGGEKQGVENARKRITNAVIGLFMVVVAYGFIAIIGNVFGIDILHISDTIIYKLVI